MKILAIGAHPDDIEIFMYGFLASCKSRGDEIYMIVATDGGAGKVIEESNIVEIRKNETIMGLKKIGVPSFLNFPDGELNLQNYAKNVLKDYINEIKPDLVLTHSPKDYHPDHRALSFFVKDAVSFLYPLIFCDTLMGIDFRPHFYVDITLHMKDKLNSIKKHKSQNPEKFVNGVEIWNRFRSAQCNGPKENYAEAFAFSNTFPFADIRSLLPEAPAYRPFYSKNSSGLL